jgi:membrane protein implicated in regulation of membrane protease activity
VSLFVVAVPALLVVVLGYAVGYALWDALGAPLVGPEAFGWVTGLVLLVAVTWALLSRPRRLRRALRRARTRGLEGEVARLEGEMARRRRRKG